MQQLGSTLKKKGAISRARYLGRASNEAVF